MTLLTYSSRFAATPEELFDFHLSAANLERISPPLPRIRIASPSHETRVGDLQSIGLSFGPFHRSWSASITRVERGKLIEDEQASGPFRRWRHQHRVTPEPDGARLTDAVAFRLTPTPIGEFVDYLLVRPALWGMFAWRHHRTRQLLSSPPHASRS